MRKPQAEKEDPKVVAAREAEQRRAETARTEETQALLLGATQRRLRRFGRLPGAAANGSGGSVSLIAPAASASAASSSGSGAAFSPMGGGGSSAFDLALY